MTPRLSNFRELKQHFPVQICVCTFIFFLLYYFFFSFPTASNNRPWRRSTPEITPSWALEHSKLILFSLLLLYIFVFVYHPYPSGTVNFPNKIKFIIPPWCRHNGNSRSISFRSSYDFLNKIYSSTITAPSRLCHLQFYRNRQYTSPDNKHGQDSGDFTTS